MVFFFPFFFFFFLLKNMAEAGTGFLEQLKSCIVWSWTYLWTLWFFIMLFLVYILRVPLKINDNLTTEASELYKIVCYTVLNDVEMYSH
uniref:Suppressor of tumorigenicity 7 protein n=2 Tax=Neognathae TaxID=8825 RepID=A0A8V0XBP5_CHICK